MEMNPARGIGVRGMRSVAFGVMVLLLSGCYAYVPVEPTQVRPDQDVRVRLSMAQARELDPQFVGERRVLEGRVLEVGADFLLEIPVATGWVGTSAQSLHQRVRIPVGEITEVDVRSLDRGRTGILVGGALGLIIGVVVHALVRESGGDPRPTPLPPDELRIPFHRLAPGIP